MESSLHRSANLEIKRISPEIMYCNWRGNQTHQAIISAGAMILELLRENQFTKVLNDNTQVVGPWHTAADWTAQEWFPAMIAAGLERFGWVMSPDIFAEISAKRASQNIKVVKTFQTYHDALNWITTG